MMDSQENALQQGMVEQAQKTAEPTSEVQNEQTEPNEEPTPAVEPAKAVEEDATTQQPATDEPEKKTYASKAEVLERTRALAHGDEYPGKDEIDMLKSLFYRFHIAEREQQQKEYLEAGGDPEKYQFTPDDTE